jgi:tRNA pseudouridine55 synthase
MTMDGLLIVDKPAGMTSHDVVDRVRRILGTRRVGHTGTLDPFATGVMVVLIGRATRLAQFLDKDEKEYESLLRFGFETETGDATGRQQEKVKCKKLPTADEVRGLLPQFTGTIEQVPPMYSAKKIAGKKLYEHARKGVNVERKGVRVQIAQLVVIEGSKSTPESVKLRVACSAGTYIRTLAEDIGRALGTRAHLAELRRTRAGRFDLSQSITLDELEKTDDPATRLFPVSDAVAHLPAMSMAPDRVKATRNGLSTRLDAIKIADGDAVRMLDGDDHLLAVGVYNKAENSVRPKVVLV